MKYAAVELMNEWDALSLNITTIPSTTQGANWHFTDSGYVGIQWQKKSVIQTEPLTKSEDILLIIGDDNSRTMGYNNLTIVRLCWN